MNQSDLKLKICSAIIAVVGLFALVAQLYLTIVTENASFVETIIRYFSYFTIQCNILITICAASVLFNSGAAHQPFFARASTLSAVTVYIVVVGIIYNLILRETWTPTGFQKLVNELLHVVTPILFLLFWIFFVPKQNLKWNISAWLIYPFLYAIYTIIRGAFFGFYPYPFMDVNQFGYTQVLINSCGMVVVFMGISFLFVAVGKGLASK